MEEKESNREIYGAMNYLFFFYLKLALLIFTLLKKSLDISQYIFVYRSKSQL